MAACLHTFWLSKRGNAPEEYEDAFSADMASGRFAIADGATESGFAALWAGQLVKGFVGDTAGDIAGWTDRIAAIQEQWDASVRDRPLPWYGRIKRQQGAFATFLGLVLSTSGNSPPSWRAIAVGDACLFHTRGETLLRAFPLERAAQFNNSPPLVGSRMPVAEVRKREVAWNNGSGCPDDRLWMMTDALARWCLVEHEAGRNPWKEIEPLLLSQETNGQFADWIDGLRDERRLRNDDVTLLVVDL
jgi:hypothetical protein